MITGKFDQYLREVKLLKNDINNCDEYPFNLPSVRALETIDFHSNVTFIVGENGSGKSTLLEAIAVAYGFNAEGGSKNFNFSTSNTHSELFKHLKLVKGIKRVEDGFFLRAESFYNLSSNIEKIAKAPGNIFDSYGGKSLHLQSHGESFISLIMNRFRGNGLYILDEPEAALSPTRQLTFLSRIHQLVDKDSQFIIATHSPIIMSYPNATIYNIDNGYKKIKYEETDHYLITKEFLNNTNNILKILLE